MVAAGPTSCEAQCVGSSTDGYAVPSKRESSLAWQHRRFLSRRSGVARAADALHSGLFAASMSTGRRAAVCRCFGCSDMFQPVKQGCRVIRYHVAYLDTLDFLLGVYSEFVAGAQQFYSTT